jgi:uncharacterized protein
MPAETHTLDLASMRLASGEGRRLELEVPIEPFELGGEHYAAEPSRVEVLLEVSRMVGNGYALRLRFAAALAGPCMRCLAPAAPTIDIDAREVDRPTEAGRHAPSARIPVSASEEELSSPYVQDEVLDLAAWARDALALGMPVQVLCRADCAGLCPECAANLNEAGPEHGHEREPDPRWAKLRELRLE